MTYARALSTRKYADESVLLYCNDCAINGALKRQSVIDLLIPAIEAGNVEHASVAIHHHINMNIPGFGNQPVYSPTLCRSY